MNFNEKYNKIKLTVKPELDIIEEKMLSGIQIREPLNTSLKNFLMLPSKRIRPVLSILFVKATSGEITDEQLELLSAVELVHNASLIHDDIIDESTFRRGEKTLSANFGNKPGVICGDYILALVMEKLTKLNNVEIFKSFSKTVKQMCLGEINQHFDKFKKGTIENYVEKTENKTAGLFETALTSCVRLSNREYDIEKVATLGKCTGTAFQIRDDILNILKTDPTKPADNDIESGIYNAPVILGDKSDNYRSGIEKTKVLLNNYIQRAKREIGNIPDGEYKFALTQFLELLTDV